MYCNKHMSTGRTHDQITLGSLPLVAGLSLGLTHNPGITLSLSGAFLFSGLMFGPDLDIYSIQFQRWGPLKILWLPYQKAIPHRSWLSHGPVIGTALRLLYGGVWLAMGWGISGAIAHSFWGISWSWHSTIQGLQQTWHQYPQEILAFIGGLELGAMSHSLSDWLSSWFKWVLKPRPASPKSRASARQRR